MFPDLKCFSSEEEATFDKMVKEGLSEEVELRNKMESDGEKGTEKQFISYIILGNCKGPEAKMKGSQGL